MIECREVFRTASLIRIVALTVQPRSSRFPGISRCPVPTERRLASTSSSMPCAATDSVRFFCLTMKIGRTMPGASTGIATRSIERNWNSVSSGTRLTPRRHAERRLRHVATLRSLAEMPAIMQRDERMQQAGGNMARHGFIPEIRLINRTMPIYFKDDGGHRKRSQKIHPVNRDAGVKQARLHPD